MARVAPENADQVCDIISAVAEGDSIEVSGGGSKCGLGRPTDCSTILQTNNLGGITDYSPSELVATMGAGTNIAELEALLRAESQQLAFEPRDLGPFFGKPAQASTIGGIIATNVAGPRRIHVGSVRDHFLGFEAVSGRAEMFKSGGRVVKNVTGFDLSKMMAGAYGTLAVLLSISVKVLPAPEDSQTLVIAVPNHKVAGQVMVNAQSNPQPVSGVSYLSQNVAARSGVAELRSAPSGLVILRLEGYSAAVAAGAESLSTLLRSFGEIFTLNNDSSIRLWLEIRDIVTFLPDQNNQIWRISVPPAAGIKTAAGVIEVTGGETLVDWGGGLIWLSMPPQANAAADQVRTIVSSHGGYAQLFRATDDVRRTVPVFQPQGEAVLALTKRLKSSFDPRAVLNPGRMYPGV